MQSDSLESLLIPNLQSLEHKRTQALYKWLEASECADFLSILKTRLAVLLARSAELMQASDGEKLTVGQIQMQPEIKKLRAAIDVILEYRATPSSTYQNIAKTITINQT